MAYLDTLLEIAQKPSFCYIIRLKNGKMLVLLRKLRDVCCYNEFEGVHIQRDEQHVWIIDSGTSRHITYQINVLYDHAEFLP